MSDKALFNGALTALEEKLLFQEDTIQKLDDVVRKQYDAIDRLTRRLKALEDKVNRLQEEVESQPATVVDEKPPHY